MVLRSLGEGWDGYRLIPRNSEKNTGITMTKKLVPLPEQETSKFKDKYLKFTFKDSMSFLQGSLEKNTEKLVDSKHPFNFLKNSGLCKTNGVIDKEKLDLLVKKGVYPYDAIINHRDLHRATFPSKNEFFSTLGVGKHISDEDWEHGKNVWDVFNCRSMMEYSKIYVWLDTILLLEAWEPVCEFTESTFGLHPAHFYTLPSLAMACCLKMLHDDNQFKKIELLKDMEMINFVSAAKRGGLTSTLGSRLVFSRAGAKDVKKAIGKMKDQNPKTIRNLKRAVDKSLKESLKKNEDYAILYLDANNLYGEAQTMSLPHSRFRWGSEEDLKWINMFFEARASGAKDLKWSDYCDEDTGFFIEADLDFADEDKDKMSNFPPAPHKVKIDKEALSEYVKDMLDETNENYIESEKLCVTLCQKKKYITHHKLMDLYSKIGVKVSNITRCLKFHQAPFLKKWVAINTEGRMTAQKLGNEIKKNFHKLCVNSVYGKFGENLLKQSESEVVYDRKSFDTHILSPYYKNHHIINENLAVIEKFKDFISLDRPIQIASSILELAKYIMYRYHYEVLVPAFGKRVEVCYSDTDSLVVRLKTKNLNKDLLKIIHSLDTSNFPKDHPLRIEDRGSKLGYFKSETGEQNR